MKTNMLIDEVTIKVMAGDGGRGAVAFDKNKMGRGATGARGGDGGNVVAEGVSDLTTLQQFRFKKEIKAENGENGKAQFNDGRTGEDIVIKLPVGTVIQTQEAGTSIELLKVGERIIIAKGGHGGKGNFHFRSPKNTSPTRFQEGLPGENFTVKLELKLIADIGLIGLPNAGKSSLLNELTNANAKVGNYAFTTLEPNLGSYYGLILADIPGLIEGASKGKGLGDKFLRHIERTQVIFHLVSAESKHPIADYKTIRKELKNYSKTLFEKPEHIIVSKTDTTSKENLKKIVTSLKKQNPKIFSLSIHDAESLETLKKTLNKFLEEKNG